VCYDAGCDFKYWALGVFRISYKTQKISIRITTTSHHAHRTRLEKSLFVELSRSPSSSGYFNHFRIHGGFRSGTASSPLAKGDPVLGISGLDPNILAFSNPENAPTKISLELKS
jgi:hypothetical protein